MTTHLALYSPFSWVTTPFTRPFSVSMLNKGKGPAVHALRVQTDRKRYHEYMKHALELTPGLAIHQAEVVSIETENGRVKGVVTQLNGEYSAKCVVIATGTNLGGIPAWKNRCCGGAPGQGCRS